MRHCIIIFLVTLMASCTKQTNGDELEIPEYSLSERFSNISTAPDLILIKVKNPSRKQAAIIIESDECWGLLQKIERRKMDLDEYTNYMLINHDRVFELSEELYDNMTKSHEAVLLPKHEKLKGMGREFLVQTFVPKASWSDKDENNDIYEVSFQGELGLEGAELMSFARLFLEEGLRVYRSCEGGDWNCLVVVPKAKKASGQQQD